MRVLLINPRFRLPIDTRTTPHLGLAYLAAVSERRGDEVMVYDADVEDESVREVVRRFDPHVVGITANTPQVKQAWRTAAAIKEVSGVPVVLGGPHPSVLPEESALQTGVDAVVRGEGEETWLEICDIVEGARASGADLAGLVEGVPGVTYRAPDGDARSNPARPPIADLDSLPWPAYRYFKMERYTNLQPATDRVDGSRSFSLMTSRGCPYRCTYCSQSIMPQRWRARSPENVVAEWRHLVEDLGAQEIGVLDDSANIQPGRLTRISELLIENNLSRVPWIFVNGIRANIAGKELLAKMKEAGLKRTAFGVESGDPEILLSINKKLSMDTIREAFRNAKEVGLETIGFFIIGLPGETEETMERTIRFACELDPLVANFSMMTPFPGTMVYEIVKEHGHMLMKDWEDYVFFEGRARYEMGNLTAELMERKWREAHRRFYLRPRRIWQILTRREFWLNFPRTSRMAFRTLLGRRENKALHKAIQEPV